MDKLVEVLDDTSLSRYLMTQKKQRWYDTAACGMLQKLKDWWMRLSLCDIGHSFGYFPKPSKIKIIFSLPARLSGLGFLDPCSVADLV